MTKLWEVSHPYYINEGNYFKAGCHELYESWDDFLSGFGDADMDYNWFVAWEWREGEDFGANDYKGDDYYCNGRLLLQLIQRRKSILTSHEIKVCRADEPAVRAFLQPYWEYTQRMWAPLSDEVPQGEGNE